MSPELTAKKNAALDHVQTVRGQLDEVARMLESDAYCVEVMKQIQTVQHSLERANRVTLHNHLETCFSDAVLYGRGQAAIDELVDAVKFTPALTGPQAQLNGSAIGQGVATKTQQAPGRHDLFAARDLVPEVQGRNRTHSHLHRGGWRGGC